MNDKGKLVCELEEDFVTVLPGDQYTELGEDKRVSNSLFQKVGSDNTWRRHTRKDFAGPSLRVIRRASEVDTPHVHKCIYEC